MYAATLSGEANRLFASFSFAGQLLKERAVFASLRANLFLEVTHFLKNANAMGNKHEVIKIVSLSEMVENMAIYSLSAGYTPLYMSWWPNLQ